MKCIPIFMVIKSALLSKLNRYEISIRVHLPSTRCIFSDK